MKIVAEKVSEVTIGKNEAGLYEYKDIGIAIEMGDKAYVIKNENPFLGTTENIYFKDRKKAEQYKQYICNAFLI